MIRLYLLLATLFASDCVADLEIRKWCKGDQLTYSTQDLSKKDFVPCGAITTAKLCDASGNRLIGNFKEKGVYKDCSIGPRISITTQQTFDTSIDDIASEDLPLDNQPHDFATESAYPVAKLSKHEEYLRSLDSMIDQAQFSPTTRQNYIDSKKKLDSIIAKDRNF